MFRANSWNSLLDSAMIALSAERPGVSTPAASGKMAFGEPQYGVPMVTARLTFLARLGSSRYARITRPPMEWPISTTFFTPWAFSSGVFSASLIIVFRPISCLRGSLRQSQTKS